MLVVCLQNKPAIDLARASYTPMGNTIANTFTAVLLLLLASPLYDAYRLYSAVHKTDREHFDPRIRCGTAISLLGLIAIATCYLCIMALHKTHRDARLSRPGVLCCSSGRCKVDREHFDPKKGAIVF